MRIGPLLSVVTASAIFAALPPAAIDAQDSLTVRVRARSDSGRPLEAALVSVLGVRGDTSIILATTLANHAGVATLQVVPQDSLVLLVRRIGAKTARVPLPPRFASDTIDVILASDEVKLGPICTTNSKPAISVRVPQAQVDTAMRFEVIVRDGDYMDRREVSGQFIRMNIDLAHDRSGVYDIEVSASRYRTWRASKVEVAATPCGPATRRFVVNLVRS